MGCSVPHLSAQFIILFVLSLIQSAAAVAAWFEKREKNIENRSNDYHHNAVHSYSFSLSSIKKYHDNSSNQKYRNI